MQVINENLWLCTDCVMVAVNGDYTALDYHYDEGNFQKRKREIDAGLDALPGLVPDWDTDEEWWECSDCGHRTTLANAPTEPDPDGDGGYNHVCPKCRSHDLSRRDCGYEEFSRRDCDCCGSELAGSRHRFAQLGEPE